MAAPDGGFILIAVVVALVPVALAVGMFLSTMQARSGRLEADLGGERAMMVAESGVDHALFTANQSALGHGSSYLRQLGPDESFLVEVTHLASDGADNDGDIAVDEADEDVFQVVVSGTAGRTTRRIAAYLGPTPFVPPLASAVSVMNPSVTLDINGNGIVDGRDYDLSGLVSGRPPVSGIAITPPGLVAHLVSELTGVRELTNVLGAGATPSVGAAAAIDIVPVMTALQNAAGLILTSRNNANVTMGSIVSPEITYRTGEVRFSGNSRGAGILVIDGSMRATGNFRFDGVVILNGDLDNSAGNATIYGSLLAGPAATSLTYRGNGTVRYSSQAVDLARSLGGRYTSFNGWQELAR